MKKTLLSLAFVTAGIFAFNASAQQTCCKPAQECCDPAQECCTTTAPAKGQRIGMANPFAGIELTAEQQAAMKALNEKYQKAAKENQKAKSEAKKQEGKDRRESKKAYLNDLKQILTPEQYTTYLENQVLNAPNGRKMKAHKSKKERKGSKGYKKGAKGDRKAPMGEKGQKQAPKQPTVEK